MVLAAAIQLCSPPVAAQANPTQASTVGPVTLGSTDCMPVGLVPTDITGNEPPSLPFYQPYIDTTTIDQVVQSPNQPVNNRFTVLDRWDLGNPPPVPIMSWAMGGYTGLPSSAPLLSYQRGHTDQFAYSGVQILGKQVGLWLNTMDPTTQLFGGSNALNVGCWYNSEPYARLFPSMAYDLDISFEAGVANDLSTDAAPLKKTVTQAYFEVIAEDESGHCIQPNSNPPVKCQFTYQIGYYSRIPTYANVQQIHTDGTETTSFPIAQTTITSGTTSSNSPAWLHGASIGFQTLPFSSTTIVHFRVSTHDFLNVLNAVASSGQPGYDGLSKSPLDYRITLIGVNGEIAPVASAHGQLGMSVSELRVTSTIPHHAAGSPAAFNEPTPRVVYRDGANINLFSSDLSGNPNVLQNLASGSAAGDPTGYFANNAARVMYRDSSQHIREIFKQGAVWSEWDMTASLGLSSTGSDPKPYVDADGTGHVIYRDLVGNVHQLSQDSTGWYHVNLSSKSLPYAPAAARGAPMGYVSNGVPRVVYRDVNNQIVELYFYNGAWNQWQMTGIAGSSAAYSDPQGYVDASGYPRVAYMDSAGGIHEFHMDSAGWHLAHITDLTNATPAQGNPKGVLAGGAPRIIYRGTDNDLHELVWWMNSWVHNNLTTQTRGAISLLSDPVEFTGSDGVVRIEYVGSDSQLHELYYSSGWLHRDM
jgi:hypothetical protein